MALRLSREKITEYTVKVGAERVPFTDKTLVRLPAYIETPLLTYGYFEHVIEGSAARDA